MVAMEVDLVRQVKFSHSTLSAVKSDLCQLLHAYFHIEFDFLMSSIVFDMQYAALFSDDG